VGVLDGGDDRQRGRGSFGVNVGRLNVTYGAFLLFSCVEVLELIELLLGVLSGVGQGMVVLDGVHMPQMEGRLFCGFCSHWF